MERDERGSELSFSPAVFCLGPWAAFPCQAPSSFPWRQQFHVCCTNCIFLLLLIPHSCFVWLSSPFISFFFLPLQVFFFLICSISPASKTSTDKPNNIQDFHPQKEILSQTWSLPPSMCTLGEKKGSQTGKFIQNFPNHCRADFPLLFSHQEGEKVLFLLLSLFCPFSAPGQITKYPRFSSPQNLNLKIWAWPGPSQHPCANLPDQEQGRDLKLENSSRTFQIMAELIFLSWFPIRKVTGKSRGIQTHTEGLRKFYFCFSLGVLWVQV